MTAAGTAVPAGRRLLAARRLACSLLPVALVLLSTGHTREPRGGDAMSHTEAVRLFNGRDLAGWRTWLVGSGRDDPRGVFSVQDGVLRISGDGYGYLGTERAWRDYRLVVEFRWGEGGRPERAEKARDSGVFLHAVGPDGNSYDGGGAYMAAIECQVMEGAVGDLLLIRGRDEAGGDVPVRLAATVDPKRDGEGWPFWEEDGSPIALAGHGRLNRKGKDRAWRDARGFRGPHDPESPPDEWTRIECVCRGDSVRVFVNGRLVNEAEDIHPAGGRILLQCEGSEVFFRRVEIRPLDDG